MDKKVIFLISPYLRHGGAEKQFRNLIDILIKEEGVSLHVYVISSCDENLINYYRGHGANVYIYGKKKIGGRGRIIWANFVAFFNMLKVKPDVVYGYSLYITPVLLMASVLSRKVIYSERILSDTIRNSKLIYKFLSFFGVEISANSPSLIRFFQSINLNAVIIPNCVEMVEYESISCDGYGVLARLSDEKNIHYLIENLSAGKNLNLYYTAVDEKYKNKLKSLCSSSDLNVNFRGEKSLCEIYKENTILLHPSISEGSPNVILEAMVSRKPIFCSDIVENIETGIHNFFVFNLEDSGAELNNKIAAWSGFSDDTKEFYLDYNQLHSAKYSSEQFKENVLKMVGL